MHLLLGQNLQSRITLVAFIGVHCIEMWRIRSVFYCNVIHLHHTPQMRRVQENLSTVAVEKDSKNCTILTLVGVAHNTHPLSFATIILLFLSIVVPLTYCLFCCLVPLFRTTHLFSATHLLFFATVPCHLPAVPCHCATVPCHLPTVL